MSSKPLWLKAVHKVERAVGGPIEAAVRTDTYFDLVTKATRVTGTVKRKVLPVAPPCHAEAPVAWVLTVKWLAIEVGREE